MTSSGDWEPGSRRKKLAGYWRAANELRQTYQQNYRQSYRTQNDGPDDIPGSYPGTSVTRGGDQQLVLFPSYARRHERRPPNEFPGVTTSGYSRDVGVSNAADEREFWHQEWERYKEDRAIVDVEVRGWMYAPHQGPLNRKNRMLIGLARQLSGIPAPRNSSSPTTSSVSSRPASPSPISVKEKIDSHRSKHEEDMAIREAESIVRRGEAEAQYADLGEYSERPSHRRGDSSADSSGPPSREISPERYRDEFVKKRRNQMWNDGDTRRPSQALNPAVMSQADLVMANAHLMERIAPFMANPLTNTRISAFFYNDDDSTMQSVETDLSGHFTLTAPLEFMPTHVRVLASDKLSETVKVRVTDPNGVSVISDIDDTIKHSAITSGAKEIFRNVFVRDLSELSIEGVRDWYGQLAQMGCEFHYVSNSPWQLFPVLSMFFETAGLPPGSFHLKKYNGMLQGIFEPVAERKKSTLDKLMRDFPERRFLLVGDSGEADLEVYSDAVKEYPGRILGVFIRDVTTSRKRSFFDPELGPLGDVQSVQNGSRPNPDPNQRSKEAPPVLTSNQEDADIREAIARSLHDVGRPSDALQRSLSHHSKSNSRSSPGRPPLPPRRETNQQAEEENLIDLSSDDGQRKDIERAPGDPSPEDSSLPKDWLQPPPPPSKPRSLSGNRISRSPIRDKPTPPRPRKPSTSVQVKSQETKAEDRPPLPIRPSTSVTEKHQQDDQAAKASRTAPPPPPAPRRSYASNARQVITDTYNRMPSPKTMVFGSRPGTPHESPTQSRSSSVDPDYYVNAAKKLNLNEANSESRPPIPPRKPTVMTAPSVTNGYDDSLAYGDDVSARYGSVGSNYGAYNGSAAGGLPVSKKEEAWRRRWAKAKGIMDGHGVILRSWRVGEDVQAEALELVKSALNEKSRGRKR